MEIFEQSQKAVYQAEHIVLDGIPPVRWSWLQKCIDVVFVGPWFTFTGVKLYFKRLIVMACITGLFYLFMHFFNNTRNANLFWPAVWMASMVLTFGLPSVAGTSGAKTERIKKVADALDCLVSNHIELQAIKDGVDLIRKQSLERVTRINWVLGIAWASIFWFYTSQVFQSALAPNVISDHIGLSLPFVFAFGFFGASALCYEEAVRVLYQTIDFAFLEVNSRTRLRSSEIRTNRPESVVALAT
jgi:hypothetical protein